MAYCQTHLNKLSCVYIYICLLEESRNHDHGCVSMARHNRGIEHCSATWNLRPNFATLWCCTSQLFCFDTSIARLLCAFNLNLPQLKGDRKPLEMSSIKDWERNLNWRKYLTQLRLQRKGNKSGAITHPDSYVEEEFPAHCAGDAKKKIQLFQVTFLET